MKVGRTSAVVVFALLCSLLAFGNPINDPKVIIHGVQGGGLAPCPRCKGVGLRFTFTAPDTKGTLFFTNQSGQNWNSLKLIETGVPASSISCHSIMFLSCKVFTLKNGATEILFSGVAGNGPLNEHRGIRNGQSFAINFACVKGSCWPPNGLKFNATANPLPVPEPATMALMVTGAAGIISRRKRWKTPSA